MRVAQLAGRVLDLDRILAAYPAPADRGLLSELAESMVASDDEVLSEEVHFVHRLRAALGT